MGADDNRLDPGAAHAGPQADELHHAGQRRVMRHRKPVVALGDRLTAQHFLPDPDDGSRRFADVLRQRHRHLRRKRQPPNRAIRRQLARRRMHAALESAATKVGKQFQNENLSPQRTQRHREKQTNHSRGFPLCLCVSVVGSFFNQLNFAARAISFSTPGSSMFHGVPGWMQPAVHFSADLTMSANLPPCGLMTTASFCSL